ncbi:MAG TPA: BON domain-containing protein [Burkholderiaceae bacterium]|nr:BON domain-containing protein [Burkholderiaceae bacterium]
MRPEGSTAAATHEGIGPLLAAALGVGGLAGWSAAHAQTPAVQPGDQPIQTEIVITATRPTDAVITAKVEHVLQEDPYVFGEHISVVTENGIVRLEGFVLDVTDMYRAVTLARRIAGRRRVVNDLELYQSNNYD